VGSIKNRARRIAAAAGRVGAWTSDDVERARLQANHGARVRTTRGTASPEELFASRSAVRPAERELFLEHVERRRRVERAAREISPDASPPHAERAMIDRAAVTAALVQTDLLRIRRG